MDFFSWLPSSVTPACELGVESTSRLNDLHESLLKEILLRLPVKTLHLCKCISKQWLALISEASFPCSYLTLHRPSSMPSPFVPKLVLWVFASGHKETYGLPLVESGHTCESFSLFDFRFIPDLVSTHEEPSSDILRGTCAGLVLLQRTFENGLDVVNPTSIDLYVCNPLTKHWLKLPSLPSCILSCVGFSCHYLVQERDGRDVRHLANFGSPNEIIKNLSSYNPNKIDFSVLVVNKDKTCRVFVIHVLKSSDLPLWCTYRVPFPFGYLGPDYVGKKCLVLSNGIFVWDDVNCFVAYDHFSKPNKCDTIPLPNGNVNVLDRFIATTPEGYLRMGSDFSSGRFIVWELVDYSNKGLETTVDRNSGVYIRPRGTVGGFPDVYLPDDKAPGWLGESLKKTKSSFDRRTDR